jgi:nucleoside-diphosphate-sugar epimerase
MPGPVTARMIQDTDELDDLLSEPSEHAVAALTQLPGDIAILGVAGKMGPTLARMARRAADRAASPRRVIGVARFSDSSLHSWLERCGVETVRCDLLDARAVARLPDAPLVVYMAGRKFGSTGHEPLTWAMNAAVPVLVAERYAGSRIAAFSTGNVYGLVPATSRGSRESDLPRPVGEYAMSCLARERLFQHYAEAAATPTAILRLNYATEMRYGLLVDLAQRIVRGEEIDLTMGFVNVIWQGDANAMALAALALASTPARIVNLAGPGPLRVRDLATALAAALSVPVRFSGTEAPDALLSDGANGWSALGPPRVGLDQLVAWTADWVRRGGDSLDKPTHFESRDGRF